MKLTPELIRLNKMRHEANLERLKAKSHWSRQDFDDVFFACFEVPDNAQSLDEAKFSVQNIEWLAFDPRTPQKDAEKLQALLLAAKEQGAFDAKPGESKTVRL